MRSLPLRPLSAIYFLLLAGAFFFSVSCHKDSAITGNEVLDIELPKGFPSIAHPPDNLPTQNRITLGEKLFFDKSLSRDSTFSCGSCHLPELFFTDGKPVAIGIDDRVGTRNAPTLFNIAYATSLFWDGGIATLEEQVVGPIQNPLEMDVNINTVVERLNQDPAYVDLFLKAYNRVPDVYSLTRAIACYERTLISGNSRYDRFLQYGENVLSESEIKGKNIFFGEKGECFHCHGTYYFSSNRFENNGLYSVYADSGRARITLDPDDYGKFKVPTLRNIALTAPYMHDGSLATLEEVIEHYNSGGHPSATKSNFVGPMNLTEEEKTSLFNFLATLTEE
jgi:cytochrome c peroxidase